jgi:hypothetical protein
MGEKLKSAETAHTREALFERGREIVLQAPQLYVDLDVEADGIAGYGNMTALGAQSPTGESFYSEIRPYTELSMPEKRKFCEEHGLERERLLREAPEVTIVIKEFCAWVKSLEQSTGKKPVLSAFGPDFDASHLKLCFAIAGMYDEYPFAILPFDLKSLAMPLGGGWDWKKTSKANLPKIIIPDGDFTHHALEDAQYQQKLHFGMAALMEQLDYPKLVDLYEEAA